MQDYETYDERSEKYIHYMHVKQTGDLIFVQQGYMETPARYEYGPMIRDHYLIHFIIAGKGTLHIHDCIYPVQAGECFLIQPYEIATYISDEEDPWEYYWLGFTGYEGEKYIRLSGFCKEAPVLRVANMEEIFKAFAAAGDHYSYKNLLLYQSVLYRVLHYLVNGQQQNAIDPLAQKVTRNMSNDYVEQVVSIINNSYDQRLSVDKLSSMMNLNRSYLSKIFKERIGTSIKDYMTEYRLTMALSKMKDPSLTITEVAEKTGFSDPLYFSRVFKKKYGLSPTLYRMQKL